MMTRQRRRIQERALTKFELLLLGVLIFEVVALLYIWGWINPLAGS